MTTGLKPSANLWFKGMVAGGFVLALVSVGIAVGTYRFVAGHLAMDHLNREAGRIAAILEYRCRVDGVESPEQLAGLLGNVLEQTEAEVAWIRALDREGRVVAQSGDDVQQNSFDERDLRDVLDLRRRNVVREISTSDGRVMVAMLPFRFQTRAQIERRQSEQVAGRKRRFNLVEVALYIEGAADAFRPLQRNLAVGIAAPVALLVLLVVAVLRFPSYMRGRELDQQLELAHSVQRALIPEEDPESACLEVTSEFRPFWGVGGDYFDVFTLGNERTFVVLGDVSGKGLPAALIMGLLHGSVRSIAPSWNGTNHDRLANDLNQLLCTSTASNRFVTFFWACYEPGQGSLHFINAGHNPPFVVRRKKDQPPAIETLPASGPVLGLLPGATYQKGRLSLRQGDLLVLYSDGLVEATNSEDVEFGEGRLQDILEQHSDLAPTDLKQEILSQLKAFLGHESLHDDLTLLIVKVRSSQSADSL